MRLASRVALFSLLFWLLVAIAPHGLAHPHDACSILDLVDRQLEIALEDRQRVVDLVRGRGGERGHLPQGDGLLGERLLPAPVLRLLP